MTVRLDSYSTVYIDEISGLVKVASSNPTRNVYITIVALKGSFYAFSLFEFSQFIVCMFGHKRIYKVPNLKVHSKARPLEYH